MMHEDTDILFVGAGPAALWTAIQTKLRSPHSQILMYEKNRVYLRSHVLQMHRDATNGSLTTPGLYYTVDAEGNLDSISTKQQAGFERDPMAYLHKKWRGHNVPTNQIEHNLQTIADALGIKREFCQIIADDSYHAEAAARQASKATARKMALTQEHGDGIPSALQHLTQPVPVKTLEAVLALESNDNVNRVVIAEGSHSFLRQKYLADTPETEYSVNQPLKYICELKCRVQGDQRAEPLSPLATYKTLKVNRFLAFETVGRHKAAQLDDNGTIPAHTPITIRFFINQAVFNALSLPVSEDLRNVLCDLHTVEEQALPFDKLFANPAKKRLLGAAGSPIPNADVLELYSRAYLVMAEKQTTHLDRKQYQHYANALQHLSDGIKVWQAARADASSEQIFDARISMPSQPLKAYVAAKTHATCTLEGRKVDIYGVGDTIMGVPFFRSWNEGAQIGARYAKVIACDSSAERQKQAQSFDRYFYWRSSFAVFRAQVFSFFIHAYQQLVRLAANSPIQFVSWSHRWNQRITQEIGAEASPLYRQPPKVRVDFSSSLPTSRSEEPIDLGSIAPYSPGLLHRSMMASKPKTVTEPTTAVSIKPIGSKIGT